MCLPNVAMWNELKNKCREFKEEAVVLFQPFNHKYMNQGYYHGEHNELILLKNLFMRIYWYDINHWVDIEEG